MPIFEEIEWAGNHSTSLSEQQVNVANQVEYEKTNRNTDMKQAQTLPNFENERQSAAVLATLLERVILHTSAARLFPATIHTASPCTNSDAA